MLFTCARVPPEKTVFRVENPEKGKRAHTQPERKILGKAHVQG